MGLRRLRRALLAIALAWAAAPCPALAPDELAVVVNDDDPQSAEVGEYYARARGLPSANVLHMRLGARRETLSAEAFAPAYRELEQATPPGVQAYALAFTRPYRVACMSVTSAMAFGYARRYCAQGCEPTAPNPYYGSESRRPYDDFGIRPAMLLAGRGFESVRQLIDRGVRADATEPLASAYLVITTDKARGSRASQFDAARRAFGDRLPVRVLRTDGIRDRYDVMFYFTGTTRVPYLDTLGFLPGAIADHLTSSGGNLDGTKQMSALRWLEAGATGTYGTVVEPCNFPQKFPNPALVMRHYMAGETLIEAYWKSVVWPGQGLFLGEPLARPFAKPPASG